MGIKKLYIDPGVDMENWSKENHSEIINCLYDNIFEFAKNDDTHKVVLKVITKPTEGDRSRFYFDGITFDFMLVRDDIDETIDALLEHLERMEEYEKCAKLVELKNPP